MSVTDLRCTKDSSLHDFYVRDAWASGCTQTHDLTDVFSITHSVLAAPWARVRSSVSTTLRGVWEMSPPLRGVYDFYPLLTIRVDAANIVVWISEPLYWLRSSGGWRDKLWLWLGQVCTDVIRSRVGRHIFRGKPIKVAVTALRNWLPGLWLGPRVPSRMERTCRAE